MDKKLIVNSILKSLSMAYIISIIMIFILSLMLFFVGVSEGFISGGIIFTYIMACFVAGRIIGKRMENRRFIWGIIVGVVYALAIAIVSTAGGSSGDSNISELVLLFGTSVIGGMLGGMFS